MIMINEVVLKKYFCEKRQDYTVLEILNLEGTENFNIVRQSKIGILDLKKNIVYIGTPLYTKPNNGITINSKNDVIHDPTNIFNIPLYKNGQIFYEHIWSNQYKGVIENIKIKEQ